MTTMETFPTEVRGLGTGLCISIGTLSGIGLPFIKELSSTVIVIVILIFISAGIGVFFLRETKIERCLRHLYSEIFEESVPSTTNLA